MFRRRGRLRPPGRSSDSEGLPPSVLQQLSQLWKSGHLEDLLKQFPRQTSAKQHTEKQGDSRPAASNPSPKDGWGSVKKRKDAKGETPNKDALEPTGWSVPVCSDMAAMNASTSGVCLVSTAEARQDLTALKGQVPPAVLAPTDVDGKGTLVHVMMKDAQGRQQCRCRYCFQLGPEPVTYMDGAPKKAIRKDIAQIVSNLSQKHTQPGAWDSASRHGSAAARSRLKSRAGADALDVRPPTRISGQTGQLQVVAIVPLKCWDAILRASGQDGVFVRPFYDANNQHKDYRTVPLTAETILETALRQAAFLGQEAFGVVTTFKGFGIRVQDANFKKAAMQVYPNDHEKLIGEKYEVSGLPVSIGKEALLDFLDG